MFDRAAPPVRAFRLRAETLSPVDSTYSPSFQAAF